MYYDDDDRKFMSEEDLYPNYGTTSFGHRYSVVYKTSTRFEASSPDDLLACKNAYLEKDYIKLFFSKNTLICFCKLRDTIQYKANVVKMANNRKLWIETEDYNSVCAISLIFSDVLN